MNATIYSRVSTDEQANSGYSLDHQKTVLETHCSLKKYNIIGHYQESYSGKDFNRPEFNKLYKFVKANRKSIDIVLFTKWDRFGRNLEEALRVIRDFRNMGVKVNSVEQPLDLEQPDSKVMLAIYLSIPEVENDKNSIRTREGMRKAMRLGCYMGKAPLGYLNARNEEGNSTLVPDPILANLVQKIFKEFATGLYTAEELRRKLQEDGLRCSKQTFLNILRNPVYIGKLYLSEWKNERAELINGLHNGIIPEEIFNAVQSMFSGKKKV